jgi:CysZ protein
MLFISGLRYNLKGLQLGIKTPRLLGLGLLRFLAIIVLTGVAAVIVFAYYQEIVDRIWSRPQSVWWVWLWYVFAWLFAALLFGMAAVIAFLLGQILFSAVIMDSMSRITERLIAGRERSPPHMPWLPYCFFLIKQEIPRAVIPVSISLLLMGVGWLTPLSPVLTILSPLAAVVFLAWDNTDLVPARRLASFQQRFRFLRQHIGFHLGFGLWFLVPGVNILFLSFAPVGATLFHLEQDDVQGERADKSS